MKNVSDIKGWDVIKIVVLLQNSNLYLDVLNCIYPKGKIIIIIILKLIKVNFIPIYYLFYYKKTKQKKKIE